MTPRICASCLFWDGKMPGPGFCSAAPPTVLSSTSDPTTDSTTVSVQRPLLSWGFRCGMHTHRRSLKALWLRLTGWKA